MVNLSDNPSGGQVENRKSNGTVDGITRGMRYTFRYKDYVNLLNSEFENVNLQEEQVSAKAYAEVYAGKNVEKDVLKWQQEVQEITASAKTFLETYERRTSWKCMGLVKIPNLVSRFRLGREAVQKVKTLSELTGSGKKILASEIAVSVPDEILRKDDSTAFLNFQSIEDAYGKLWQALTTEDNSLIIGIYGMPGIGKTRMAEHVSEEALKHKIFDTVTRANVGNGKLDVKNLQEQIASCLGLYFESKDSVEHRASKLKSDLMNRGKILLILDDVWREIPLGIIGIPSGDSSASMGSKILLTCRDEDVCLRNNCKQSVKIETLEANEAWDLFSNTVVAGADSFLIEESLAKDVCSKCAGLPLLIQAIGRALKYRTEGIWEITLHRLENWKIESVNGIRGQLFHSLKVIFNNVTEDAGPCLFLCSLFPEGDDISIRTLIQLATGSQLVHGGRTRVLALVDILKSSSLLLDGKDDEHVKLHAAVRLLARSIAVEDPKYAFLFASCDRKLPYNYPDYSHVKFLHLDLEQSNFQFPHDLAFPDLQTLSLRSVAAAKPNLFPQKQGFSIEMFANLKFLVLENFLWREQLPFQYLGKLESLYLNYCHLSYYGEGGVRLFPQSLETLGIGDCVLPKLDLSNLIYLSKLEILCEVVLTQNTVYSLSSLVELHIPNAFEAKDGATQRYQA